jgi:hypothetical protein
MGRVSRLSREVRHGHRVEIKGRAETTTVEKS